MAVARGPMSAAARAKISAALKGKRHPHRGHAMSDETRAKIAAALRARYAATSHRSQAEPKSRRERASSPRRRAAQTAPRSRAQVAATRKNLRGGARRSDIVRAPGGGRMISGHHGHGNHKNAFALISTGAGYHHSYVGRLRPARVRKGRGRLRHVQRTRAHRVWARRRR